MVQRKRENKAGMLSAEMKNSTKSCGGNARKPCLFQEMIGRPSQSINGGDELEKKLKRSESLKVADWNTVGSVPNHQKDGISESGVLSGPVKRKPRIKMEEGLPNYMKPTTCSDKRKENRQVSVQQTIDRKNRDEDMNYGSNSKRHTKFGNHSATPPSTSKSINKSKRLTNSKAAAPSMKSLKRTSSLKAIKSSMKSTKSLGKVASVPLYAVQDVSRATCSSTLKDSCFPDYIALNPGGTESEGTSIMKVCPYTYCSLNGHYHKPLLPLKHFISARRQELKNLKSSKMKGSTPCKIKNDAEGCKEIDTGQKLAQINVHQIPGDYIVSSPRFSQSDEEEQITLFMEDWDVQFLPVLGDNNNNNGRDEITSLDAFQTIDKRTETENFGELSPDTHGDVPLEFEEEMVVGFDEDCSQETESVTDGSCCERRSHNGDQQDHDTLFLVPEEEAVVCSTEIHPIEPSKSSTQADQPDMANEFCLWNDSDEQEIPSEAIEEMEVTIETDIVEDTANNEVRDVPMDDEYISDNIESILFNLDTPGCCAQETGNLSGEDHNDFPGDFTGGVPSSEGDEINMPVLVEVLDLLSTEIGNKDYENVIPELLGSLPEGDGAFYVGDMKCEQNGEIENLSLHSSSFENEEITAMGDVQTLQTEVNEAIDCQTTDLDNDESEGNEGISPCYESSDEHDAAGILRDATEAEVANEIETCTDALIVEDWISHEHKNDLRGNDTSAELISSSVLAVVDRLEDDNLNNYSKPCASTKEDFDILPTTCQGQDTITEDAETVAGDENEVKFAESIHNENRKEKNEFCEGSINSVPDEEDYSHMAVENQPFQGATERNPSDERTPASIQVKDVMVQTRGYTDKNLINVCQGSKTKEPDEDETETTRITTATRCSGKDNRSSATKDNTERAHEARSIQPLISSENLVHIVKGKPKDTVENTDEEKKFNPRDPNFLPIELDSDPEKVDLRHQMMDDRRNAEEWMVDYALRQAVNKLSPARKKKVALLVEAFETVLPLPKCDIPARRSAMSFGHVRAIQACS